MFELITDSLIALGDYAEPREGAVGFGAIDVPNSKERVNRLIDFCRDGCSIPTPLGRLTIANAIPTPGSDHRIVVSGTIEDGSPRGAPVTYAPKIPAQLVDMALGRFCRLGKIEICGLMKWPTFSYNTTEDSALVIFDEPLLVRKAIDPSANRVRRFGEKFLQASLEGVRITRHQGYPILTGGFVRWIAPTLTWT